jgi:hypothetical protein
MMRVHRSAHRVAWIVLGLAVALLFGLALARRAPPPDPAAAQPQAAASALPA